MVPAAKENLRKRKERMASTAFNEFEFNVMDAKRLLQAHGVLSNGNPGKKGLGHITRSGVVMLCAAWERYQEAVLVEGVKYLASEIPDPNNLPLKVRQYLSQHVREAKNVLTPMQLAGTGWQNLYIQLAEDATEALNTPKSENLKALYSRFVGVTDVSAYWTGGAAAIDSFVTTRGDIAHNGRTSPYIKASVLRGHIDTIERAVRDHDHRFCDTLKGNAGSTRQPWRKTA
ncbi:HEPN domain-containing protein [Herbaspirillum rubrisubalbicans]|uniref:HEPN domain-containing protein n=1 Tax=Herbaspirillum rubrisubalbicans TaxID=80842 RepID=UPI0015C55054|nr:HEPN domain-containing protein [Herbaspirillum rubrisubalbicans]